MFITDPVPYFAGYSTKWSTPPITPKASWSGLGYLSGCQRTKVLGLAGSVRAC